MSSVGRKTLIMLYFVGFAAGGWMNSNGALFSYRARALVQSICQATASVGVHW